MSIARRVVGPRNSAVWQRLICVAIEERELLLGYGRGMRSDLARPVAASLRRHPVAADAGLAVALSVATLVSLYTTFELLRQDPQFNEPAKPAIVLSLLAVTVPLALRRRYPLTVACVVIVALVAGRAIVNPNVPGLASLGALPDAMGLLARALQRRCLRATNAAYDRGSRGARRPALGRDCARGDPLQGRSVQRPATQPGFRARLQRSVHRPSPCCSVSRFVRGANGSRN